MPASTARARDRDLDLVGAGPRRRVDADARRPVVLERQARQQADLAQARELSPGLRRDGELCHQLHRDREREHRSAVDAVIVEVAIALEVERVACLEGVLDMRGPIGPVREAVRAGEQRQLGRVRRPWRVPSRAPRTGRARKLAP